MAIQPFTYHPKVEHHIITELHKGMNNKYNCKTSKLEKVKKFSASIKLILINILNESYMTKYR